jgi:hypothetical protein
MPFAKKANGIIFLKNVPNIHYEKIESLEPAGLDS